MSDLVISLLTILFFTGAYYIYYGRSNGSIRHLRGPQRPSFLLGHQYALLHEDQVGDSQFAWVREYGPTFPIGGCFGTDILFLADPKGLQHVMHTGAYFLDKPSDIKKGLNILLGRGILGADALVHQRHRKIMNPAFSPQQLRSSLPLFQRSANRLTQKWKAQLEDGTNTFNVCPWLSRLALDALGDAAFDYRFGALDDDHNELAKCCETLLSDTFARLSKGAVLFQALWKYLPAPLLHLITSIPTPRIKRLSQFRVLSQKIAAQLILDNCSSEASDVMSILSQSNQAEDEKKRLDEEEVLSQMATMMIAGQETTASTLSWMLYELARHPDLQRTIREEIKALRARLGVDDFSMADLDSLAFLNACIKETLRFHPTISHLERVALREEVVPLQTPATSISGDPVSEVVIKNGQQVLISICAYNRLPVIWGDDADEWRPSRFLDHQSTERHTSVGVFANLLTFSAGVRSCIGWRFAMIELQAVLVELMENFHFSLPDDGTEVWRISAGTMIPMVKGKLDQGPQMPLKIIAVD